MKKLLTRIVLPLIAGVSFTVLADNVHATDNDTLKTCKSIFELQNESSKAKHFRAVLSLSGVHGAEQDSLKAPLTLIKKDNYNLYALKYSDCLFVLHANEKEITISLK